MNVIIENVYTEILPKDGIRDYMEHSVLTPMAHACVRQIPNFTGDNLNSHRLPHSTDENTQIPPPKTLTLAAAWRLPQQTQL